MKTLSLSVKKLNSTISLMDKPCDRGCKIKKIAIAFQNLLLIIPRIFTGTKASSSQVRKVVKYYTFYAKPADRSEEKTRLILQLYDKLAKLKRHDGKSYAYGIERDDIQEIAQERMDPKDCFVKLKGLNAASPRVLFNLSANKFGEGSPLASSPHLPMLQYVHNYLSALKKQTGREPVPAAVLKEMSKAIALLQASNFVKTGAAQASQAIAKKERLLIPGGWKQKVGFQPYYYEVIPQDNNTVSFRIYNLSDGAKQHGTAIEDLKSKISPFVEWKGIASSKITDVQFWQILNEMLQGKANDYKAEHIYYGLKRYLDAKEADSQVTKDTPFMTSQQGEVHKALNGFLRCQMSGPEYHRLMISLRLQALVDKVHKVGITQKKWWHRFIDWLPQKFAKLIRLRLDLMITPESEGKLIEKCHSTLSCKITRVYNHGLIGKDFMLRTRGLMEKVSKVVERNRMERTRVKPMSASWSFSAISRKLAQPLMDLGKPLFQTLLDKSTAGVAPKAVDSYAVALRNLPHTAESQPTTLKQALELSQKGWKEAEDVSLNAGIMHYIRHLPIDDKHWNDACGNNSETARAMIGDLGAIHKILFQTFLKLPEAHRMRSERDYALTKVQYIQKLLLASVNAELAEKFEFSPDRHSPHFVLYDPKMQQEWQHMRLKTSQGCFTNGSGFSSDEIMFSFKRPSELLSAQLAEHRRTFWDVAQPMVPKGVLKPKVASSPSHIKNAFLFASDALPAWLRGIRDAYLCRCYYSSQSMPMAGFESRDRTTDLEFNLRVDPGKDRADVYIRLKGTNEEIKAHQGNKERRDYKTMHRPVKAPSQVHELFQKLESNHFYEKDLLSKGYPEDIAELLHLFLHSEEKGVTKLMGFFNKHPQLLEEPEYQNLFDFCFRPEHLEKNHKAFPDLPVVLGRFLNQHYTSLIEQNKIQPAVMLLQQMRRFANFFPEEQSLQQASDKLKALLRRQGLEPEHKSCIYTELLAMYGDKETLTHDETIELIAGHTQLTENPLPNKWRDPVSDDACRAAIHVHANAVRRALIVADGQPNQEALCAIFQKLRGISSGQSWKVMNKGQGNLNFTTSDDRIHFSPLLGQLVTPGTVVQLPSHILRNSEFHRVFPDVEKAEIYAGGFRFFDAQKCETLVRMEGDRLIIEKKCKVGHREEWCQYIPSSQLLQHKRTQNLIERIICAVMKFFARKFPVFQGLLQFLEFMYGKPFIESALGSRHLVNQYAFWRSHSSPKKLFGMDIKTGKQELELLYDKGRIRAIKRNDGMILGTSNKALAAFEVPEYVHQWYNPKGSLAKVELPRFGITFTPLKKQLFCDQFKGFKLELGVTILPLGSYHHYLVLKNDKGETKVLVPRHGFQRIDENDKEFQDSLKPTFALNRRLGVEDMGKIEYYAFDFTDGKLDSSNRAGNIYLANALTHAGEFKRAYEFLKKYGFKLSSYTDEEKESLMQLINSQKVTGNGEAAANALRSYAGFLYLKNGLDHHVEMEKQEKDAVIGLYQSYLTHRHNSSINPFTTDEELFLVYHILSEQKETPPDPLLIRRLGELENNPEEAANYQKFKEVQFQERQKTKEQTAASTGSKKEIFTRWDGALPIYGVTSSTSVVQLRKNTLVTDPARTVQNHFTTLTGVAKQGSAEEKAWLKTILCFVLPEEGENQEQGEMREERKQALALTYMLEYPDQFTPHPEVIRGQNISYEDRELWRNATRDTLNQLIETRPIKAVIKAKQPLIRLAAPGFQFERPAPKLAPNAMTLTFQTPETWSSTCDADALFEARQVPSPNVCGSFTDWLGQQNGVGLDAQEYDKLKKAQQIYSTQNVTANRFMLGKGGIHAIESALAANCETHAKELMRLKGSIEFLANRPPALTLEKALHHFNQWSGKATNLTIDEVIIAFGKNNPEALLRRNAALDVEAIHQLFNQVGSYLILASHEQQRERALATLASYKTAVQKSDALEQEALLQQLGAELNAKRCYDPAQSPEYLVFEYFAQILIRKEQFNILKLYFEIGNLNLVHELIMGWGKSSVIVPLLGLLRAKPDALSLLIVPPQLLEEVATRTQAVHRDAYGKQLHGLHFDRDSTFTAESLAMILFDLKNIMKNRECLITTNRSIQCLLLKTLELVKTCGDQQEFNEEDEMKLTILRQIMTLLRESSTPLIDEIDSVLDVMLRLVYSFGKKEAPAPLDIEVTAHLITILLNDPALKKLGKLECDPSPCQDAPVMTVQLFDEKVQIPLAQAVIEYMKTAQFSSVTSTQKVQSFFQGLTSQDKVDVESYLTHKGGQAFFDKQDQDIQNVMSLLGEQISNMLKRTITRPLGVKYGVDKDSKSPLAIPFISAGQPHRGSQFANSFVTMNYTLQYYLKEGVPKKAIKKVVKGLQASANRQSKEEGMPLAETAGWKTFKKLCGDLELPSLNLNAKHFAALHKRVNSQFDFKRDFVVQGILPRIDDYEGTLSCNAHNTGSFFKKSVDGLTATLSNPDALPGKLKTYADEEITVKMLNLLWEKSANRIHCIREGTPESMFEEMRAINACNMVIDGGGYFKVEGSDLPVAQALAKASSKPVAFFGESDALEMIDANGTLMNPAFVAQAERNVFIAQRFGVGANVKVHRKAEAVLTVGRDTTLPKFLQFCGRLYRELNRTQTLAFCLSEEVEDIVRQMVNKPVGKLDFGDLLVFLIRNHSTAKGRDTTEAFQDALQDVKQEILIDALLKVEQLKDLQPVVTALLPCWFKQIPKEPRLLYGQLPTGEESSAFAERKRINATIDLANLIKDHPILQTHLGWTAEKAKAKIDEIVNHMKSLLPPTIVHRPGTPLGHGDPDAAAEVETETELDTEIHKQIEVKRTEIKLGRCWSFDKRYNNLNEPSLLEQGGYFDLSLYMQAKEDLRPYAAAFKGIDITVNSFAWPEKASSVNDMELFGPYRTPIHFVRIIGDEVCILSDDDHAANAPIYCLGIGDFYKKCEIEESREIQVLKYQIQLKEFDIKSKEDGIKIFKDSINCQQYVSQYTKEKEELEKERQRLLIELMPLQAKIEKANEQMQPGKFQGTEAFRKVVKIKFLNGDCDFTLAEQKVLREWFQEQGPHGAQRMEQFYHNHILKGFSMKAQAYRGSSLERVFRMKK